MTSKRCHSFTLPVAMRFGTVLLLVLAECLAETHVYPEFPQSFTLSLDTNIYGAPKTSRIYVSRWKDDTGKESFSIFLNETESLIGILYKYLVYVNIYSFPLRQSYLLDYDESSRRSSRQFARSKPTRSYPIRK